MINLKHLSTIGLASALFVTVLSSTVTTQAQANSFARLTTLVADRHSDGSIITQGNFVTVEQNHPTEGQAQIVEENGARYLKFDADFTTARGPDVNVVLHRNSSVPVNLQEENYLTLAALQSFDGAQQYLIPDELNLDEYQAVAIWCREFNVTFGYASFSQVVSSKFFGSK